MKRICSVLITVWLVMSLSVITFASEKEIAENSVKEEMKTTSNVNLTVVIPTTSADKEKEVQEIKEATIPKIYPVSVYETTENGSKQIIKTYELGTDESPVDIPRESFERDGWCYELTDIIKKETAAADVREHTKAVNIDTDTKEIDKIVNLLAPTMEYSSDDGYAGILNLDIQSISVGTAGTKNSTFTVSAVREYPHLSSNDTSLVPKTITDNGRTMTLSGVNWRTATSSSVDYNELPNTYTAVATYTTTGSKTVVTGYTTIADYKGTISKMINGKTVYTAIFHGTEIPLVPIAIETIENEMELTEEASSQEIEMTSEDIEKSDFRGIQTVLILILAIILFLGCLYFFTKYKNNQKGDKSENKEIAESENEEEFKEVETK